MYFVNGRKIKELYDGAAETVQSLISVSALAEGSGSIPSTHMSTDNYV